MLEKVKNSLSPEELAILNYIEDLNEESKEVIDFLFSKRGNNNDN